PVLPNSALEGKAFARVLRLTWRRSASELVAGRTRISYPPEPYMATVDPAGQGQSFPCTNCGAKLAYDATSQQLKCPYCGHQQAIPKAAPAQAPAAGFQAQGPGQAPAGIREIPLEEGMRLAARGLGAPVTAVGCKDCGATVNVAQGEQTAKCAFCG